MQIIRCIFILSHLKKQKLAALKDKNIKLIFRLKAQKQVFKQNLKESHNRARHKKINLMRQVRETERKKLQNL